MKPRILLINPWIHDFAAFNLWARPLGLIAAAEFLSAFDVELQFIDCLDSFRPGRYGIGKYRSDIIPKPSLLCSVPRRFKRYGIRVEDFRSRLLESAPFDAVLMTSIMTYWYPGLQEAVALVREQAGGVPIVLGGIYPRLYPEHADRNSGADFIFHGPVNDSLLTVLDRAGVRLKRASRTLPIDQLGLYDRHPFVPLLTSRGCPYRCSYCASALLNPSYERNDLASTMSKIRAWHSRGVREFAFYDDALLHEPDLHAKPLLREIIRACPGIRLHAPNGLHARFIDDELAELMNRAGFMTIRLSLETIDPGRQQKTGAKVSTGDFERALRYLRNRGFGKEQVGVYLLYGLPGQSLEEVDAGVHYLQDLGVSIMLAECSPIRGTETWKEFVNGKIIPDALDPLLTNNSFFSWLYSGYDHDTVKRIKLRVKEYNAVP